MSRSASSTNGEILAASRSLSWRSTSTQRASPLCFPAHPPKLNRVGIGGSGLVADRQSYRSPAGAAGEHRRAPHASMGAGSRRRAWKGRDHQSLPDAPASLRASLNRTTCRAGANLGMDRFGTPFWGRRTKYRHHERPSHPRQTPAGKFPHLPVPPGAPPARPNLQPPDSWATGDTRRGEKRML